MRLGILGKLTLLSTVFVGVTILIISLISWYNNSNYIFSRLNSRFPTLAVLKSQQLDQYVSYTTVAVQSIASRLLLQQAVSNYINNGIPSNKTDLLSDLMNGVENLPFFLSGRILVQNQTTSEWSNLIEYTPSTPAAQYYAPIVYSRQYIPPLQGITSPFTISGRKYVFVITTTIPENTTSGVLQIIFDAVGIISLLHQVNNQAEATTEYMLVELLNQTFFRVLLPTLYHPEFGGKVFAINSDSSVLALQDSQIPSMNEDTKVTSYDTGIVYSFNNFFGQQSTAGYSRLFYGSRQRWGLIVQAPQKEVEQPLDRLRTILLISAFSTLILMTLIVMPLIWCFLRPVRTLREVTREAKEAPISIEGLSVPERKSRKRFCCIPACVFEDEISDLKEAFILLAQSLNEQYYTMDSKVAQRTADLQVAQKTAIDANNAKSAFLASISHEIRSPLQGVIALADINMLEDSDVSDEIKQTLITIRESGHHLLFLISDILDFSKIEAGHLLLEERVFSLGQGLINQLRISFRPKADEVGLRFDIVTDPPELYQYRVRGDKHRLYQVLSNLLSNAVKFTISGSVTLKVTYSPSDQFQFAVQDTGPGITSQVLEKLFQPFTQADSSYSRKFGGTGLGLSISKQLARLMGGDIFVESKEDVGSIFTLQIPLKVVSLNADEVALVTTNSSPLSLDSRVTQLSFETESSTGHSVRNVLLVDDNAVNRKVLSKMLEKCGVKQITLAENGLEAVNIAQKRVFDAIFMDISMPVMNGVDATRNLRESGYEAPIIALTASVAPQDSRNALEGGVDHVLNKPIVLDELKSFLRGLGQ